MAEEAPVCGQTDALRFPQMNVALSDFNEEATQVGMQLIRGHISLHGGEGKLAPSPLDAGPHPLRTAPTHTPSFCL